MLRWKMTAIVKEKERLNKKLECLKEQEKKLLEKEKMIQRNRYIEIGKLAYKAKIGSLDEKLLLGAFLEISQKMKTDSHQKSWEKLAEDFQKNLTSDSNTPLTISFEKHPEKEIQEQLKGLKFRWNSFRGEYYGYGDHDELRKLLKNCSCTIEVVH